MGRHLRLRLKFRLVPSLLLALALGIVPLARLAAQEKPSRQPPPAQRAASPRVANKTANSEEADADDQNAFDKEDEKDGPDEIQKRLQWFYKQRSNVNGHIPAGVRAKAFEHLQQMLVNESKLKQRVDGTYAPVAQSSGTSFPAWTSIGPTPTIGSPFGPVTGRITTIAVDPSDSTGNTVLIGGAQGGIWRTTDAGQTWTAVGDQNASLAMGSIAFAPSNSSIVYAGTGEQASIGFDIYYGAGVLISNDHGHTWKQTCTVPGATCPFIGPYDNITPFGYFTLGGTRISYVAVNPSNPQMVLVGAQTQFTQGTTEGVYCSDNSGQTWTNILPDEMSTFVGFASSTVAYAALGNSFGSSPGEPNGNGIYKATAIGSTCSTILFSRLLTTTLPLQSSMGRIEIGLAPGDTTGNTFYASIADSNTASSTNLGVYSTTNGGQSFIQTVAPDICRQQCWYDNVLKVDPIHSQIAFFGGSAVTSGGAPSWVIRTTDGGNTWASVIPNVPAPNPGIPHVDSHALAFVKLPSGKVRLYLGNDGGIWRTDDAEESTVSWTNLNGSTLTLSQFYPAISIHPSSPTSAIGGTQDNGTQSYSGSQNWSDIGICGDGTGSAIDNVVPSTVYIACNGPNLLASYQNGVPSTFNLAVNGINPSDFSNFVPPFVVDPSRAGVIYLGTTALYQSLDSGNTWTTVQANLTDGSQGQALTALQVAPKNPSVLYAGSSSGQVFVSNNVGTGSGVSPDTGQGSLPPRTVSAIAVDPADSTGQTAYVAFSGFSFVFSSTNFSVNDPIGHIFKTTNLGASWVDISCSVANCQHPGPSDLPNLPVNDIVIDPDLPGTLYAANDLGVYVGTCTGAPCTWTWSTVGTGLPRVAILSLKLHQPSRTLRAATHGRGVWDVVLNNFTFPPGPHITSLSPTSANASGNAVTLIVNGSGLTGGTIYFGTMALAPTGTSSDTTLSGTVPKSLLVTGTPVVTVKSPGNVVSNPLTFVVVGSTPTLTAISPTSTPVQKSPSSNIQVTLSGTNFTSTSNALWNGLSAGITVKFNNSTSITATLPSSLLGPAGGTNDISVQDPPPGGGVSQAIAFKVVSPPPPNDNFVNAINVTAANFSDTQDSSGATTESNDPTPPCITQYTSANGNNGGHPNGVYNTIWYKFTPTFSATAYLDTVSSSYDTVLSVWTGAPGSFTSLACNDDIVSGVVIQSQLQNVSMTAGTTYYMMVSSFGPPDPNPVALGGASYFRFLYNNGLNPPATVTSVSPATAASGGPGFTLTVNGTSFLNGAIVFFNNVGETTTFVSSTQLTATVNAADITLPATTSVFVANPSPGGGPANNFPFTITVGTYPVPTLNSISPTTVYSTTPSFLLNAYGQNFASTAILNFNGAPQQTTVNGPTSLYAAIPASLIAAGVSGTFPITVTNPSPGGGTSTSVPFVVQAANPIPTITSISPTSSMVNPANPVVVTITGTNFATGASALFNGGSQQVTSSSATQITMSINQGYISTVGVFPIQVIDPSPGGYSNTVNFTVTGPPDFTIAAGGNASQTVNAGQTATFTNAINIAPVNGFSAAVTLNCTSPAAATTCSITPNSLPTGNGSATVQVTTMARSSLPPYSPWPPKSGWPKTLPLLLASVLALLLAMRFRRTRTQRLAGAIPMAIFALLLFVQLTGCGGGGGITGPPPPRHGTQVGTYLVNVTATAGTTTHATTLTLIVN